MLIGRYGDIHICLESQAKGAQKKKGTKEVMLCSYEEEID